VSFPLTRPQLGESDTGCEHEAIKCEGLRPDERFHKTQLGHTSVVTHEMKDKVADACCHKGSKENSQPFVILETPKKRRKEVEVNQ
jgi:hypothetical protein